MPGCPVCLDGEPRFACRAVLYAGCERDVYDCARCGAAYYFPMPSGEDIGRCYPPVYFEGFFKQYWKDYYKGRAFAERLTAWREEGDFLDVGCALGTMLAGVRDHSRWRVRGIEFSPAAADLGSRLNGLEIKPVPLARAPWPAGSFDFVHINNVLEHESDPRAALAAAAGLLKPGGRLELTVPNGPVDLLPNRTLSEKWGRAVPTRHGGHLFFFSKRALETVLPACGLRVLSIRGFHLKLGAKARGWTPNAYRQFAQELKPVAAGAPPRSLSLEEGRAQIPPARNWTLYKLSDRWRRLWRFSGNEFGYDFEVLAEKV
jgi:SAM-dependent methyltransferase